MNSAIRLAGLTLCLGLIVGGAVSQERELRGLWMTPREGTRLWSRDEIRSAMRQTADANFNTVYFLAWSRGWPLWDSRIYRREFGIATDPAAGDRDILSEAVEEAHAAGLHIEAWMEYGFVGWWSGNAIDSLPYGPIFAKHPEWLAKKANGSPEFVSGHVGTFYWMAHSQPAVQTFLADLHAEVAANYDVEGIELDRIRYPNLDCGYDSTTMALFAADHHGAPTPGTVTDASWMRWRADRLVDFHRLAYQRIKKANPRLVVSNAPGHYSTGEAYSAYDEYLQDWRRWLSDSTVDLVQIQMYGRPGQYWEFVQSAIAPLEVGARDRVTSGLAAAPNGETLQAREVVDLVRSARKSTPTGHSFWYYHDLRDAGLFDVLRREVYQTRAVHPRAPVDRSERRQIRPGVQHHSFTLAGPYTLDVVEIDLRHPGIRIETFRADSLRRSTEQVRRREKEGGKVVAAVNADFFSFKTHWPIGNQVSRGSFVVGLPSQRSHFGMMSGARPVMDPMSFSGSVVTQAGHVAAVRALNDAWDSTSSVMYTPRWGTSTRTPPGVWEASLSPLDAPAPNMSARFVVQKVGTEGNRVIPEDGWVWSATAPILENMRTGDTLQVSLRLWAGAGKLIEVVGGGGRILREGRTVKNEEHRREGIGIAFTTDRHPRTFVAMDQDSTRLFLGTVDGRQASSIGMNFREMARFLRSIGAWNAVNLDGGGSTTMVVDGVIVNSPSDRGGERAVANSVMVVEDGLSSR